MIFSIIGFCIMFVTAFVNKINKDEIKESMLLKRLVILGILGGLAMGVSGLIFSLLGG